MLDVVHALYEEDAIPLYEEHAKVKSSVRVAMWQHIYNKDYPYPYSEATSQGTAGGLPPEESLLPAETTGPKPIKPYIAPTNPDQFQSIGLDAPMGGPH